MLSKSQQIERTAVYGRLLKVNCMKFTSGRDGIETIYGKRYTFSLEYDEVEVMEATPESERPKEYLGNQNIQYHEGAKISGKKVWGSTDKRPGRIKKGVSGERSGRHSRQTVYVKGAECYAEVITSWTSDSIEIHPLEYIKSDMLRSGK